MSITKKKLGTHSTIMCLDGSDYYVYLNNDGVPCAMEHAERGEIGGLWIENNIVEDYDGCYQLPNDIITLLKEMKIDVSLVE